MLSRIPFLVAVAVALVALVGPSLRATDDKGKIMLTLKGDDAPTAAPGEYVLTVEGMT